MHNPCARHAQRHAYDPAAAGQAGSARAGGRGRERQLDPEDGAGALGADHADAAAHALDHLGADREAEAGAAAAAGRRGVGLLEGLEDALLHAGRDADAGVLHLDADRVLRARRGRAP